MMTFPYIDMHCDTLLRSFHEGSESIYKGAGSQSIALMKAAGQLCQFFAVYFPSEDPDDSDWLQCNAFPEDEIFFQTLTANLDQVLFEHADEIAPAKTAQDILDNQKKGLMSAVLTVEDGRMVQGKTEMLKYFYDCGVRAVALTWNYENCFGYPNDADPKRMGLGLKPFGLEAVEYMNELGILVDVSHLSDGGFYDVASVAKKPFIASHSNTRALSCHPRNLTDDMIRVLSEHGGAAGLNLCPRFLTHDLKAEHAKVEDMVAQVMHLYQVGGEDCIAIGTDFDGFNGTSEVEDPTAMHLVFEGLHKAGLSESQLEKFANRNVLRVMRDAIG